MTITGNGFDNALKSNPTTGCNATNEIAEFGFLGAPTSIQGTSTGLKPADLKKLTN